MKKELVIAAMVLFSFVLMACDKAGVGTNPNPPTTKSIMLTNYASCAELESEIKELLIGEMEANLDSMKSMCRYPEDLGPVGPVPVNEPAVYDNQSGAEADKGGVTATDTNVQEEGVDEADLIKTDGNYTYAIIGNIVKIAKVWPFSEFGLVSTITPEGDPQGLYLVGDKLIILSTKQNNIYAGCIPEEVGAVTKVGSAEPGCVMPDAIEDKVIEEVYDVTDKAVPKVIKTREYKGWLLDSRRIASKLYLIIDAQGVVYPRLNYDLGIDYSQLPGCPQNGEPTPSPQLLAAIEKLKEANRAIINGTKLSDLIPAIGDGEINCEGIMHSDAAVGTRLLEIVTDEYGVDEPSHITSIFSNGGTVYASLNSIYVTSSFSPFGWWGFDLATYEWKDSTVIHRFSIANGLKYFGSGEVDGHLFSNNFAGSRYSTRFSMSQFALSELEGSLRVATTKNNFSMGNELMPATFSTDNYVSVLDINSSTLAKVGEVKGFGGGENIYAVRFIGKMGYIVTFEKTDPLFVIDISDPKAPKVAGKLEVPGFSTYLHPFGVGYLIGLGFGAEDMGGFAWTQGLKLALFDVSDPNNPIEVPHTSREIGSRGSYSPAVEEHHAFTLDKNRGMIALPVDIYEGGSGSEYGTHSFSGVMVLKADPNDIPGIFTTIGKINIETIPENPEFLRYGSSSVLRTVILGDDVDKGVITLTTTSMQLNKIDASMTMVDEL